MCYLCLFTNCWKLRKDRKFRKERKIYQYRSAEFPPSKLFSIPYTCMFLYYWNPKGYIIKYYILLLCWSHSLFLLWNISDMRLRASVTHTNRLTTQSLVLCMKAGAYQCNRRTGKGNICQNKAKNWGFGIGVLSGTVMFFCEFDLELEVGELVRLHVDCRNPFCDILTGPSRGRGRVRHSLSVNQEYIM